MRLDKLLAHLGYGTRKEVKKIIKDKEVSVDGEIITNPETNIDELKSEVIVFDETVQYEAELYFLLNKPKGVVSATFDNYDETVLDLFPNEYQNRKLFPVGRLDKDTTGLLLITNDGVLAHQLLSPKHHVKKVYEVKVDHPLNTSLIPLFEKGITLEDGTKCQSATLELISENIAHLTIYEGKFHQVKRMFKVNGYEVIELKRIAFGNLTLPSDLKEGSYIKIDKKDLL